jgi:proline dehydrogenase
MFSFSNTEIAFKSKSKQQLRKAYYLFKVMGNPFLSKYGGLISSLALKVHLPIKSLIKNTVFEQFCGGETLIECERIINALASSNIKTILDYSVEGKQSEKDFNVTTKQIIASINFAKTNTDIPFAVFKITGVARFKLLEKINCSSNLTEEEKKEYARVKHRINKICKSAHQNNIPVMIDAEESWIQDVIDELVEEMMRLYNKQKALIYNTIQLYRHDRLDYLKSLHENSKENGYYIGVKLVRGAYIEKENERALRNNYSSPIQASKKASDVDYDLALEYCCENIHGISICAGTHNETSSKYLMDLMKTYKIRKNDPKIYFSQLLGMSDHISYNLAASGYNCVKYVPYGPVKEVLPYLVRRAEENTSIAGQTGRELKLIIQEMKRRN